MLSDQAEKDLHAILEEAAARQDAIGDLQKVGAFYASFMDEARAEELGSKPLEAELKRIDAIRTPRDLAVAIGRLQRIGVNQPFAYYVGIDEKNSSTYVSYVFQTGLGMPDRDYYLSDDARMKSVREQYRVFVRDLLQLAGSSAADATAAADRIFNLELRLAKAQWTRVQNRDANKTYNKHSVKELQALTPRFDWRAFLEGAASPKVDDIVVNPPSFFKEFGAAVADVPLAQWREYLRYKVFDAYGLSRSSSSIGFDFNGRCCPVQRTQPAWKRGVSTVEVPSAKLRGAYVSVISAKTRTRVKALVGNCSGVCRGIQQLE